MNQIMDELNQKFAGQSAARLTTYAGKMDLLKVSAENAKEEIGEGLLDALTVLSKDDSITNASNAMEGLATNISDAVYGMALLIAKFKDFTKISELQNKGAFSSAIPIYGGLITLLSKIGSENRPATVLEANKQRSAGRIFAQQYKIEIRQEKEIARLKALEIAALKKKTAVDKLKDKFDLERIGLAKALNETTDAEIKLRLEAKFAILDNNEALADKILAEMDATKSVTDLSKAFGNATAALDANIAKLKILSETVITKLNTRTAEGTFNPTGISGLQQLFPAAQGPLGNIDYTVPIGSGNPVYAPGVSGTPMSYADVRLTIDVAQSGDQFAQLIADSVQVAQRSGYSTTSAGSLN
jgi:hypothetical protein